MTRRLVLAVLLLLAALPAQAATYYVDLNHASCNDSGAGTSLSAPWCTFTHGLATAVADDTVYVRAGTYNAGSTYFSPAHAGTSGHPIAFRRYGTDTVILTRTYNFGTFSGAFAFGL